MQRVWVVSLVAWAAGCGPSPGGGGGDTSSGSGSTSSVGGSTSADLPGASTGPGVDCQVPGSDCSCSVEKLGFFSWSWDFREWSPLLDGPPAPRLHCTGDISLPTDGATIEMLCSTDTESDLSMGATFIGPPTGLQYAPYTVIVEYQPEVRCPNGCYLDGGHVAVRDLDTGLLRVGAVDAQRDAEPEPGFFDWLSLEVVPTQCPVVDMGDCDPEPSTLLQAVAVRGTRDGQAVLLLPGEQAMLGTYELSVIQAIVGQTGGCIYDGGDPSHLLLLLDDKAI